MISGNILSDSSVEIDLNQFKKIVEVNFYEHFLNIPKNEAFKNLKI